MGDSYLTKRVVLRKWQNLAHRAPASLASSDRSAIKGLRRVWSPAGVYDINAPIYSQWWNLPMTRVAMLRMKR
jgi:hypothetical protein